MYESEVRTELKKQYCDLTEDDLRQFPNWAHVSFDNWYEMQSDDDYITYAPIVNIDTLIQEKFAPSLTLLRTTFVFNNGQRYLGYSIYMGEQTGSITSEPTIVSGNSHWYLSFVGHEPNDEIAAFYSYFGLTADEVFPIRYKIEYSVPQGKIEGVIEGFYWVNQLIEPETPKWKR